jgi:hypothetical protein
MADKVRKVSILLQALSRVPGLGFLADTDHQLRETADSIDDVGDQIEEGQRHMEDIRNATGEVSRREDD